MGSINETTQPSDSILPPNPCVRNCCLNERDICLGCGRTLQEIFALDAIFRGRKRRKFYGYASSERGKKNTSRI
ncbi:DUF1289 domain-containing protein [Vibrio sinaloensis]|nr:DUF1289 domain-containing protein [Vibrio sinaloensis]